jgi:hypothetical protein
LVASKNILGGSCNEDNERIFREFN